MSFPMWPRKQTPQADPGTAYVAPDLLKLAADLAARATKLNRKWFLNTAPVQRKVSHRIAIRYGLLTLSPLLLAFADGQLWSVGVAAACVLSIFTIPRIQCDYAEQRAALDKLDGYWFRDTAYLAKHLRIAHADLSFSLIQVLAARHLRWVADEPKRRAAEAAAAHKAHEAAVRADVAARRVKALEAQKKTAMAAASAPGATALSDADDELQASGQSYSGSHSGATADDDSWEPEYEPNAGMPEYNTNGMPMIEGTMVDVTGDPYGMPD